MIDLIKKQQIILRHVNNDSNRQIAKDLGIDKNRGPKASTTEAQEVIRKCLAENEEKRLTGRSKQQMRKTDIHGYLVKQGFDNSYSTVKRLVREMEDIHKEAYIRQEYEPGQIAAEQAGQSAGIDPELLMKVLTNPEMAKLLKALAGTIE